MEKLTTAIVQQLVKAEPHGTVVTIYAPMHTTGSPPHITENQIRFKNLMHAAITELEQHEGTDKFRKGLKEHMERTLADVAFFEGQTRGLLLLASPQEIRMFHLPVDTEEYVAVDDTYHLAPVMGLMHDAAEFYVLTVAQHTPALFRGDMYGLYPTDISLPESLIAGLNIDETNQKSEHSLSAGGSSLNTSAFNGRGGARNPGEEDRMRFFRMIDNIIMHKADRSLPMVLAGIDAETAEYRHLSKYPTILQGTISGSYSQVKPADLFDQADAIIHQEVIAPRRQEAIQHYEQLSGANPERTAGEKDAIESAAEQGRIETLLLRMTRTTTDTIRDTLDAATRITFPDKSLSTSLNKLAIKVAAMSGTVLNLDDRQMPNGRPVAATLRF